MMAGSRGMYNTNSQIKFKTTMLQSILCEYSDAYVLVKRTTTVVGAGATPTAVQANRVNKQAIFKYCAPFSDNITQISNPEIDYAKDLDVDEYTNE